MIPRSELISWWNMAGDLAHVMRAAGVPEEWIIDWLEWFEDRLFWRIVGMDDQ